MHDFEFNRNPTNLASRPLASGGSTSEAFPEVIERLLGLKDANAQVLTTTACRKVEPY
jgi:hypothetical protein